MIINLQEIWDKNRYYILFSFLVALPITFTPNIFIRIVEVLLSGLFFWMISFVLLKNMIKKDDIDSLLRILRLRYEDKTFLPSLIILIILFLICLIPLSLFFGFLFNELITGPLFESINIYYLTYIVLIFSFPVTSGIFIGFSIILTDIPIKVYLKLSKSDLSIFEWLFHRKIKNKQIYQAKNFATQCSFFEIIRTSFYYIILVTSALYTLYYGSIIAFGVEITINSVEIIMGLLTSVIFVNTLFWNYYKRYLFINELGLVVEDSKSKLIKKIDPKLFEKNLKSYLSAALFFSILTTLPKVIQIISNLSDYYNLILSFSILPAFFILQSVLFYLELRMKKSNIELKSDLLRKNKIKTCKIEFQITPIPQNDSLSS